MVLRLPTLITPETAERGARSKEKPRLPNRGTTKRNGVQHSRSSPRVRGSQHHHGQSESFTCSRVATRGLRPCFGPKRSRPPGGGHALHRPLAATPAGFFYDSGIKRRVLMLRAFADGEGWACRLLSSVDVLAHYTLHAAHLGLPESAADARHLFDPTNIQCWKHTIKKHFRGPLRWKLELGEHGRIHVHVLADLRAGLPELPRGGELVKPCAHYLETLVAYLSKPPAPYTAEALALWMEARQHGPLPHLSGTIRLPNLSTWRKRSASAITFDSTTEPPALQPAQRTSEPPQPGPLTNTSPEPVAASQRPAERIYKPLPAPRAQPHRVAVRHLSRRDHHEVTRTSAPRRRVHLADLFAPVTKPQHRRPGRASPEHLSAPKRLPEPPRARGGPSPPERLSDRTGTTRPPATFNPSRERKHHHDHAPTAARPSHP